MLEEVPERNKGGRPRKKVRGLITLSPGYTSKIGSECGDMFETVSRCATIMLALDKEAARDLATVAERLAKMHSLFI